MLYWRISFLSILLCALFSISCGFMDLRTIGIGVEPNEVNSVLPAKYSPVVLKFDTEMEKKDAEGILQVTSDAGVVRGDRLWKGNDLYFVPAAGWTAGIRYTLSLSGAIRSVDGRELRIERFVPFYAINRNAPPLLEWHSPANGESTGTNNVILEFRFSRSMDRLTVESALTIEGAGNKTFEWLADDKILKVIPDKALSAWTVYRWNLNDSAKSLDGVPLPRPYSGQFTTNLDQILPYVERVFPVLNSDGRWFPTGLDIETGLGPGHGIAVEFNKPMGENVLRSLRFEPSLTGRTELLSENCVVYIFTRDPEPAVTYTLIVSPDTRDSEGLKTGDEYRINFVPDIPFLNILSFNVDSSPVVIEDFTASNNVLKVPVDPATGELYFNIRFSLLFTEEEKQNTALKILLAAFFPRTAPPAALQYARWVSDDRLRMGWEGLTAGNNDEAHFYKLTIPGGKGGITGGGGMYMKEDISLYLEAVR